MRYISLFSGIEAASVAWKWLGWEPLAFSEIEPFPCAVLEHHYPNVPNLGDITRVNWRRYRGKCDVIIGGSPCQSFSIAGRREGLAGESGLMFEYIRAVREVRPGWFIWENVPGAFTVEGGRAFKQLLSEMDKLGYGVAWNVYDAQFFGVAQRRRRVFVVGHLGDMRAADVLFEPESLRGDIESSREKRQALAADAARGAGDRSAVLSMTTANTNANGSNVNDDGAAYTLDLTNSNAVAFAQNTRDEVRLQGGDGQVSGALAAQPGMKQQSYVITQYGDVAGSLTARADSSPCADRGQNVIVARQNASGDVHIHDDTRGTITAESSVSRQQIVCMADTQAHAAIGDTASITAHSMKDAPVVCVADDNAKAAVDDDLCGSLKCGGGSP